MIALRLAMTWSLALAEGLALGACVLFLFIYMGLSEAREGLEGDLQ